nr:hypothetical protein [Marinicella sp. W31]MDC2877985.1 hypothetical protein [Marinicella sp. W31]
MHMKVQDVRDVHDFIMTLPKSSDPSKPHDLAFPFNNRLAVSFWKQLFLTMSRVFNWPMPHRT